MGDYCIESVDFGPTIGELPVCQVQGSVFQAACLQENSSDNDCTGLRIHAGAHVAIRFLVAHPELIESRTVCEFGCGTGIYGLVGTRGAALVKKLVLTDGNDDSVSVAYKNIENFVDPLHQKKIICRRLLWSLSSDTTRNEVLQANNAGETYDIAIGCELMYYRTDPKELLSTVLAITGGSGLFLHSHVFRRRGQGQEIVDFLSQHGWNTIEVPIKDFVDPTELTIHPEWYNVRCLISGPNEQIQDLLAANSGEALKMQSSPPPSQKKRYAWKIFVEEADESDDDSDSDENEEREGLAGLFKRS